MTAEGLKAVAGPATAVVSPGAAGASVGPAVQRLDGQTPDSYDF